MHFQTQQVKIQKPNTILCSLNECDIAGLHIANFVGITTVIVICPFHGMKISDYIPCYQSWIYIFGAMCQGKIRPPPPLEVKSSWLKNKFQATQYVSSILQLGNNLKLTL